jgi:hypothetical protein
MKKKLVYTLASIVVIFVFVYFGIGFYLAYTILRIDPTCGLHEGSLPNTWSTKADHHEYSVLAQSELRKNFPVEDYHLEDWQEVYFPSRDQDIKISGWLFNYFPNRPVVVVVHGIFPNGKCKPESNLIASLLIKNEINALTIDLRNYGQSATVSEYEHLGLSEYADVLGAFDFLQKVGFKKNQIGLHGISLGGTSVIFAAEKEPAATARQPPPNRPATATASGSSTSRTNKRKPGPTGVRAPWERSGARSRQLGSRGATAGERERRPTDLD